MKTSFIDDITRQVTDALPKDFKLLSNDVRENFRATLHSMLNKMDLVTREEFDTQSAVLQRTREKLETLEKQLLEIEKKIK
ncbi:MAG: accessory factor UbiK family protein [Gammaproteobacteria bacterium]